jgi:hypothetical protein
MAERTVAAAFIPLVDDDVECQLEVFEDADEESKPEEEDDVDDDELVEEEDDDEDDDDTDTSPSS